MFNLKSLKTSLIISVALGLVLILGFLSADKVKDPNAVQRDYSGSLEFGGITRVYHIHIPPSYDRRNPAPLLFAFHGLGGDGKWMENETKLNETADQEGFIVVYPDGYKASWSDGSGVTPAGRAGVDDVGFVSALIDKLANELQINLSRVYATGFSNGAMLSQRLACELSGKIAAIASVGGTMVEEISLQCNPERPISIMHIHGTEDRIVPWEGGEVRVGISGWKILSVNAMLKKWAGLNACSSSSKETYKLDRYFYRKEVHGEIYKNCKNETEVIFYELEGAGHSWPGIIMKKRLPKSASDDTERDNHAEEIIWEFFERHTKK